MKTLASLITFLLLIFTQPNAGSAQAQNIAASPDSALRAGMTLKAPQRCADKSGVTLDILSLTPDGKMGTGIIRIFCWGNTEIINAHVAHYHASISISGSQITVTWRASTTVTNTIAGTISGSTLTFGTSRISMGQGWLQSGSLVFQ